MRPKIRALCVCGMLLTSGCRTRFVDRTDRDVYGLIQSRQRTALGIISDARIQSVTGEVDLDDRMYRFNPRPLDPEVPEPFRRARQEGESPPQAGAQPQEPEPAAGAEDTKPPAQAETSPSIFSEQERDGVTVFGLRDALAYAMRHGRELQDAKEDLYLAALDLSLERHLWTPQFVADATADYAEFADRDAASRGGSTGSTARDGFGDGSTGSNSVGGVGAAATFLRSDELDRSFETVSEAAVTQRLRYGGTVSARVIHRLMRDVSDRVSKGESAQVILQADVPLLRGAGRVAYEGRYVAERELIYAVRTFERFRRSFLTDVAADYFNLQQAKAAIDNTFKSYQSRKRDWEKAEFIHRVGRSRTIFEAPRARANFRRAEADLVSAKERDESALDRFKIFVGMPVDALLDVVDQSADRESNALDALLPTVDQTTSVQVAVTCRLDLLTSADQVDDARRGIAVSRNAILPDLSVTGSLGLDSNPTRGLDDVSLNHDRTTWQAGLQLRMNDRKRERNDYRSALLSQRRAERDYELMLDNVRADVRRALRRIAQQKNLRMIQALNVKENEKRLEAARAQFDLGKSTNQDVVDAETELLRARNAYAAAVAAYRVAILEFRRDTGTLRVSDGGRWEMP